MGKLLNLAASGALAYLAYKYGYEQGCNDTAFELAQYFLSGKFVSDIKRTVDMEIANNTNEKPVDAGSLN